MEWTSCHETEGTMRLISTPSRLYRALALAEWVTWTLLLAGMFVKYVLEAGEWLVRIGGGLHGFTFLSYADRKSTRLNSSHVAISYAVFCSKKENSNKLN